MGGDLRCWRVFRISLLLLVCVTLGACSTIPGATQAEPTLEPGWTKYTVEAGWSSIALPPGWQSIDTNPGDFQAKLTKALEANPQLPAFVAEAGSLLSKGLKFYAFDARRQSDNQGLATFGAARLTSPSALSLNQIADSVPTFLDSVQNSVTDASHARVSLAGEPAEMLDYKLAATRSDGGRTVQHITQYMMVDHSALHILVCTIPESLAEYYAGTCENIAQTFRFPGQGRRFDTSAVVGFVLVLVGGSSWLIFMWRRRRRAKLSARTLERPVGGGTLSS